MAEALFEARCDPLSPGERRRKLCDLDDPARATSRGRHGLGSPSLHGSAAGWDRVSAGAVSGCGRHGHAEQFQAPRQLLLAVEPVHDSGRYERASCPRRSD